VRVHRDHHRDTDGHHKDLDEAERANNKAIAFELERLGYTVDINESNIEPK
jgi:hypothetical protein